MSATERVHATETATTVPDGADSARVRTVLVDGYAVEVKRGWNHLPDGRRLWLYPDGTWQLNGRARPSDEADGAPKAMDAVGPEGNQGSAGGMSPIQPGHTITLRHGAKSPRTVNPIAAQLVEETVGQAPFLAEPSFRPALEAWARAEARCLLLEQYLDEHGLLDPATGEPRPATSLMTQQENLALKHRTRLGLDAASRAGIEASLTSTAASQASLEAALAAGAEALRARWAHQDSPEAPLGSDGPSGAHGSAEGGSGSPEGSDGEGAA